MMTSPSDASSRPGESLSPASSPSPQRSKIEIAPRVPVRAYAAAAPEEEESKDMMVEDALSAEEGVRPPLGSPPPLEEVEEAERLASSALTQPQRWKGDLSREYLRSYARQRLRCGLTNIGNSCYMNSVLQLLCHVPALALFFVRGWPDAAHLGNEGRVVNESRLQFTNLFAQTVAEMWRGEKLAIAPRSFTNAVIAAVPDFRPLGQQDAHETLLYVLNTLHDEMFAPVAESLNPASKTLAKLRVYAAKNAAEIERFKQERGAASNGGVPPPSSTPTPLTSSTVPYDQSVVSDTFRNVLTQSVTCCECGLKSMTVQSQLDISLELPTKPIGAKHKRGSSTASAASSSSPPMQRPLTSTTTTSGSAEPQPIPSAPPTPERGESSGFVPHAPTTQRVAPSSPNPVGGFTNWLSGALGSVKSAVLGSTPPLELEDCLESYFSSEALTGSEQYSCEACGVKRDARRRFEIAHLPPILSLHLKRFSANGSSGIAEKNERPVKYPIQGLNLARWVHEAVDLAPGGAVYDLIGVLLHSGRIGKGHYISLMKSASALIEGLPGVPHDDRWFEFDDDYVRVIGNDALQSNCAYILLYAKRASDADRLAKHRVFEAMRQAAATEPVTKFVSLAWALKLETSLFSPGPLDSSTVVCPHGRVAWPSHRDASRRVVGLTQSTWDAALAAYGPLASPELTSLTTCEECKTMCLNLKRRRKQEMDEAIAAQEVDTPEKFAISKPWMDKWRRFVQNNVGPDGRALQQGAPPPGAIDNQHLMAAANDSSLAPNAKRDVHYDVLNAGTWNLFFEWYGGGPVVAIPKTSPPPQQQ